MAGFWASLLDLSVAIIDTIGPRSVLAMAAVVVLWFGISLLQARHQIRVGLTVGM
jgi:hypothetical protein